MNDTLTTKQAAARLEVTPGRIRHLIAERRFPNAFQVQETRGVSWRIPAADLEALRRNPTGVRLDRQARKDSSQNGA